MPIFEYRCKKCGNEFEIFVRSSGNKISCPACSADDIIKKFSTFGFNTGGSSMVTSGAKSCGGCSSHNCSGCHH